MPWWNWHRMLRTGPLWLDLLAGWGVFDDGRRQPRCPRRRDPATPVRPRAQELAALKPSPEQFEKLALEQLDTVYRIARRLARDPSRAEDLVQETYLRAVRARETFDLQSHGIR